MRSGYAHGPLLCGCAPALLKWKRMATHAELARFLRPYRHQLEVRLVPKTNTMRMGPRPALIAASVMSYSTALGKPATESSCPASAGLIEPTLSRPEQLPSERLIVLALFLFSFFYLCLFRDVTAIEPDEGIILQGAQRIVAGQVLYRDFFSFYTPGSYYLLALIFRILGSSILVARTTLVIVGAVVSSITYLLSRRVCSRRTALLTAAIVTV